MREREYAAGRRQRLAQLSVPVLGAMLVEALWVMASGDGPVEPRQVGLVAVVLLAMVGLMGPLVYQAMGAGRTVLDADGLTVRATRSGRGAPVRREIRVPWSTVTAVRPVWTGLSWAIRVERRGGRPLLLPAPIGYWWWPGRGFRRDLAAVRAHAPAEAATPGPRWRRPVVAGLVALVLVASAGFWVARRGVLWPWQPLAYRIPGACSLLDHARLDRYWPRRVRKRTTDSTITDDGLHSSYCTWIEDYRAVDSDTHPRVTGVDATVQRWDGGLTRSPGGWSRFFFDSGRDDLTGPADLTGLGDEACVGTQYSAVTVLVRRADVLVKIQVRGDTAATDRLARTLVGNVPDQIRVH